MAVVYDIDGNSYNTVVIGDQEWMTTNLKTTKYNDGTSIPIITSSVAWAAAISAAYRWYNDDIANKNTYGALYNGYAVKHGLLAPSGWRVATDDDFKELELYAGMTLAQVDASGWRGINQGTKLKSTTLWSGGGTGTDNYGLTIVPSGYINYVTGNCILLNSICTLWTSSNSLNNNNWMRQFNYDHNDITRATQDSRAGSSVRCVRYYSGNCNPYYRFYISEASSTTYEVFPLNFLSTKIVDTQEKDNIFYRRKFTGSLIFGSNSKAIDEHGVEQNRISDWQLLWDIQQSDPCETIYLTITKTEGTSISIYYEGIFSTTDGNFDIDKCTFEVTPNTSDDYSDLLENIDTQYNILAVSPAVTTRAIMGVIDVTYTRNRWLMDVIEYLADKILPFVTVSSEFFTDATNPVTLNTNQLLYLTIAQKSDIKRPTSSNSATSAVLSWSEMMEILWVMFQVKWNYVVATDTINVEHISWTGFDSAAGLDLRTQILSQATNKFSYIKEQMPKYEKFTFMESEDPNFIGVPIWYNSKCVNQDNDTNIREQTVKITTDLEYIINNTGSISDSGFVILCNYLSGGSYYVKSEKGFITNLIKLNNHLSWAALHHNYFMHNRVLITGYLNGTLTTFFTALKTIKQKEFYGIVCTADSYDPSDYITTELGETYLLGAKAKVEQSELGPDGKMKFSLLYGPADNVNPGITGATPAILITQEFETLYATLTDPAPAGMDIVIVNTDCVGSPLGDITWTIPAGSYTDELVISIIIVSMNLNSTPSWSFTFIPDPDYICG
jgi:uncharacterized protein (TIGR02145 family)